MEPSTDKSHQIFQLPILVHVRAEFKLLQFQASSPAYLHKIHLKKSQQHQAALTHLGTLPFPHPCRLDPNRTALLIEQVPIRQQRSVPNGEAGASETSGMSGSPLAR